MMLYMLFGHFLADFVFQSHWMASNKSKNNTALTAHVFTYTLVLTAVFILVAHRYPFTIINGLSYRLTYLSMIAAFVILTFFFHFLTDYVTSRITSDLFKAAMHHYDQTKYEGAFGSYYHNYFVVIGFDQFLHVLAIWGTLWFFDFPVT